MSLSFIFDICDLNPGCRFTVYNFNNMQRMSYYPHNQPVIGLGTESDDTERTFTHSGTGSIIPTATILERSQAGSPILESTDRYFLPPIPLPRTS